MRYYSIVLLSDGSPVCQGWVAPPFDLLPAVGAQGHFREDVVTDGVSFVLDGTARGGHIMCAILKDGQVVTHTVVVSGAIPERDQEVLGIFLEGARDIGELTTGVAEAFVEVATRLERPFCATLLLPLESKEVADGLLAWLHRWVGAHLAAVMLGES